MTATEMAKGTEEKAIQLASLRAELIREAARLQNKPLKEGTCDGRTGRKWWEFFVLPNA